MVLDTNILLHTLAFNDLKICNVQFKYISFPKIDDDDKGGDINRVLEIKQYLIFNFLPDDGTTLPMQGVTKPRQNNAEQKMVFTNNILNIIDVNN